MFGNEVATSEYNIKEAYIYNNNNNRQDLSCRVKENYCCFYLCDIICTNLNVDSSLLIELTGEDETGIFFFPIKKE